MRITFVYTQNDIQSARKPLWSLAQMQFGISYISSLLKKHGHNTRLMVLSSKLKKKNEDIITEHIKKYKPQLICFTSVLTQWKFVVQIAEYIKKHYPAIYLIAGGSHVSLNKENAIQSPFDAICVGEGEYPMLELVSQIESNSAPAGIQNLWIKHGSEIEKKPPRPFLDNLDELPFPDRQMWREWTDEKLDSLAPVLAGRGCPFECTYCCNHSLKKVASGQYVRYRSPDNIVKEIEEVGLMYPATNYFYIEIETITVNRKWAIDLCSELARFNDTLDKPLKFRANLRITPNAEFEDIFAAFKKANFNVVNIGVESGSERIRREVLKRRYSNKDVINAVKLAKKNDIDVSFLNMIGFPGETPVDFEETIKINRQCLPAMQNLSVFYPYPGTKLHTLCNEQGLMDETSVTEAERTTPVLQLSGFTKKQIRKNYIWFE